MTTKNSAKKTTLPPGTTVALRDGWMRTQGAVAAARAAQQVAAETEAQYKQQFKTCLELMGLDPELSWEMDLKTGELKLQEQPLNINGTMPPGN